MAFNFQGQKEAMEKVKEREREKGNRYLYIQRQKEVRE